ncbi:MAG: rhomboid family intramembrane serine protease [Planctomycetota bacterium]
MFLPLRTDVPLRHTPYMNGALILVNMVLFAAQLIFSPRFSLDGGITRPGFDLTAFGALQPLDPHWWNFITYAFMHSQADLLHLVFNMVFLYIFGNAVNEKLGHWGYLGLYLGGAAFAGLAHALGSLNPVIGASGAMWTVIGAYIVLFPRARVTVLYFFFLIGTLVIPGLWLVGIYLVLDVLGLLGIGIFGGGNTAHLAHLGGALFGVVVSLGLLWLKLLPRDDFDALALINRWNRRRQFRDMTARGFDPFDATARFADEKKSPAKSDPKLDQIQDLRAEISETLGTGDEESAAEKYRQLVAIDEQQVLSAHNQLLVAGTYYRQGAYADAAAGYERYLRVYPRHDQADQTRFMLGLIYNRYLGRPEDAKRHLEAVVDRLHDPEEVEIAREELEKTNVAAK